MLFDDLAPLTKTIGFIKAPLEEVKDAFVDWCNKIVFKESCVEAQETEFDMTRCAALLEPLVVPGVTKYLLVEVGNGWVAYFDNCKLGSNAGGPIAVLTKQLHRIGVVVSYTPHTMPKKADRFSKGRYGGTIFEYFDYTGHKVIKRSLYAVHNGGSKWLFEAYGQELPFEDLEAYKARVIRKRFTLELLNQYLGELGIAWRDLAFYENSRGFIIHRKGNIPSNVTYMSLSDIHREWGE